MKGAGKGAGVDIRTFFVERAVEVQDEEVICFIGVVAD